jgi:hypothetical protein
MSADAEAAHRHRSAAPRKIRASSRLLLASNGMSECYRQILTCEQVNRLPRGCLVRGAQPDSHNLRPRYSQNKGPTLLPTAKAGGIRAENI